jgi:hypothetical protein
MIETATQHSNADRNSDQHGKCKSRWIPKICGKEEHMEGQAVQDGNGKRGTQLKGTFEQVTLQLKLHVTQERTGGRINKIGRGEVN